MRAALRYRSLGVPVDGTWEGKKEGKDKHFRLQQKTFSPLLPPAEKRVFAKNIQVAIAENNENLGFRKNPN